MARAKSKHKAGGGKRPPRARARCTRGARAALAALSLAAAAHARARARARARALAAYDLDADGIPELISCWSNGALTVRSEFNGEVIYRDTPSAPIAAAIDADLRLEGKSQMIVCATDGEVRGYVTVDSEGAAQMIDEGQDQKVIAELQQRKQDMLLELHGLETNIKQANAKPGEQTQQSIVPQNARVSMDMATNEQRTSFEFVFMTNNNTFVISVIVLDTDGGIFEGETLYTCPRTRSNKCCTRCGRARTSPRSSRSRSTSARGPSRRNCTSSRCAQREAGARARPLEPPPPRPLPSPRRRAAARGAR